MRLAYLSFSISLDFDIVLRRRRYTSRARFFTILLNVEGRPCYRYSFRRDLQVFAQNRDASCESIDASAVIILVITYKLPVAKCSRDPLGAPLWRNVIDRGIRIALDPDVSCQHPPYTGD